MIYHNGQRIGHFPCLPGTKGMVMLSEHAIADRDCQQACNNDPLQTLKNDPPNKRGIIS